MRYFEAERPPGDGACDDTDCPCPGVKIPRGAGYLYVSPKLVEFRRDALSIKDLEKKVKQLGEKRLATAERAGLPHRRIVQVFGPGDCNPMLICEQAAKRRRLDLEVAAADARHWWSTGQVPLRPTPGASSASD
jgi:hypothetical protein